jgi:hypothetical protein
MTDNAIIAFISVVFVAIVAYSIGYLAGKGDQ